MSASILRNLVSKVFNVPATSVKLSGVLSPDYCPEFNTRTDYCNNNEYDSIWGFHPQKGFIPIAVTHSDADLLSDKYRKIETFSDGSFCRYRSIVRHYHSIDTFEGVEEFIFFVVHNYGQTWENTWDIREEWNNWIIYKSPNFAAHWAAIEEKDIKRWEEWLNA